MKSENNLGNAIALAADIHRDDLYGDGPYIFHLMQVLKTVQEQGWGLSIQIAAILHDAIEDHPESEPRVVAFLGESRRQDAFATLEALARRRFDPEETYDAYIKRVILDPHAAVVKLADLQRNAAPKPNRDPRYAKLALDRYIPAMAVVTKAVMQYTKAGDL